MTEWAWLDGKIVSKSAAVISGFDEGFMLGRGLFETMRCYKGRIFLLHEHLKRLIKSSSVLGMKAPSFKLLREAVLAVVEANASCDVSVRLNVSECHRKTKVFVFTRKLPQSYLKKRKKGFSAILIENERIGETPVNNIKSLSRAFYARLKGIAEKKGFDEAIFLNSKGEVAEGTRTNIFAVVDSKILTPKVSCGCLPGITRKAVIGMLKNMGHCVREERIFPQELLSSSELFLTNSLIGVMPLVKIGSKKIGSGGAGVFTRKIMKTYQERVEKECRIR